MIKKTSSFELYKNRQQIDVYLLRHHKYCDEIVHTSWPKTLYSYFEYWFKLSKKIIIFFKIYTDMKKI